MANAPHPRNVTRFSLFFSAGNRPERRFRAKCAQIWDKQVEPSRKVRIDHSIRISSSPAAAPGDTQLLRRVLRPCESLTKRIALTSPRIGRWDRRAQDRKPDCIRCFGPPHAPDRRRGKMMSERRCRSGRDGVSIVAKSKKHQAAQTGSQSANFHEGTRSEYLAHYVFSSFGTSVPVPHPEDTGIDLHCTLTETIGQRIWPVEYYMVQVKSTDEPWVFSSKQSVEQLYKPPSPVFFCIVTKEGASASRIQHAEPALGAAGNPLRTASVPRRHAQGSSAGARRDEQDQPR